MTKFKYDVILTLQLVVSSAILLYTKLQHPRFANIGRNCPPRLTRSPKTPVLIPQINGTSHGSADVLSGFIIVWFSITAMEIKYK